MKRLISTIFAFFLCPLFALADTTFVESISMGILVLESVFVIVVSVYLMKFIIITRKKKIFMLIYVAVGLFLLSSTLNLFYKITTMLGWLDVSYEYVFVIERLIIVTILAMLTYGFLKFNKMIRVKI